MGLAKPRGTRRDVGRFGPRIMESILYARLPEDDIVVIRILDRGNHGNSLALREVLNLTSTEERSPRYVLDLEKCATMDSTFMGVVAVIALRQLKLTQTHPIVVGASGHVRMQLELLGLKSILEIRSALHEEREPTPGQSARFASVESPELSKVERIALMIEAHERLIDVEGENEVKFNGVLESLRESLKRSSKE